MMSATPPAPAQSPRTPSAERRSRKITQPAKPTAKGIVEAMGRVDLKAPIVIRLDGTNAEEGRQILLDAGIPEDKLRSEPTMLEAARAAVALAS